MLIDRHNYHQFQPLFYQVATAGLEPSSISFPLRKIFQKRPNIHFRMASLEKVIPSQKMIETDIGTMQYDYLVLAMGVGTNYFGMESVQQKTVPMKSVSEAIYLRNRILMNFEKALNESQVENIDPLLNFVIVGGGPTGVELAGALAEMKKTVLPKDFPELDFSRMHIHLLEAAPQLLSGMSEHAHKMAFKYLLKLGVNVHLNAMVTGYENGLIKIKDREAMRTDTVIWAAGVAGEKIEGLPETSYNKSNRILVDQFCRLKEQQEIFVIGDLACMQTDSYPNGHPQVAQVAIQQAKLLAANFKRLNQQKQQKAFKYKDQGSLATVGRKLAVADLPWFKLQGFTAWLLWLFVHLMQLVGIKNRFFVFINWWWNYVLYDQSLRVLIRPKLFKYQEKITE